MAPITSTLKPDAPAWIPSQSQAVRNDESTQTYAPLSSMWDVPERQYQHSYAPSSAPSPSMSQQQLFAPPEHGSSTPFTDFQAQSTPVPLFVPHSGYSQQQQDHGSHFYPSAQILDPHPYYQDQHFEHQPSTHAWHPHPQLAGFVHPQDPYARQLYQVENTRLGGGAFSRGGAEFDNGNGRDHTWNGLDNYAGQRAANGYKGDRAKGYKGKKNKKGGKKWKAREEKWSSEGDKEGVSGEEKTEVNNEKNAGVIGESNVINVEKKVVVSVEEKSEASVAKKVEVDGERLQINS
jgi:hypothetical protein